MRWTKFTQSEVHLSRGLTHIARKFGRSAKPAVDLIVVFNKRISTIDQAMATPSATVATPSATANWTANLDARISTIDKAMATSSATVATPSATANWTANLDACGLYYEGLVEDIDTLLEMHKLCTVTTYGTRRSRRQAQSTMHVI